MMAAQRNHSRSPRRVQEGPGAADGAPVHPQQHLITKYFLAVDRVEDIRMFLMETLNYLISDNVTIHQPPN